MKEYKRIRCPLCKGNLIIEKSLRCSNCNITYPIKNSIPVMLPSLESVDNEQDLALEKEFI